MFLSPLPHLSVLIRTCCDSNAYAQSCCTLTLQRDFCCLQFSIPRCPRRRYRRPPPVCLLCFLPQRGWTNHTTLSCHCARCRQPRLCHGCYPRTRGCRITNCCSVQDRSPRVCFVRQAFFWRAVCADRFLFAVGVCISHAVLLLKERFDDTRWRTADASIDVRCLPDLVARVLVCMYIYPHFMFLFTE